MAESGTYIHARGMKTLILARGIFPRIATEKTPTFFQK